MVDHIAPHRPVRITLAQECELVVRGLTAMLAAYSHRVEVLGSGDDGEPAPDADITLHDCLSGVFLVPGPGVLPTVPHVGRLVAYTWLPRPDLVDRALDAGVAGVLCKRLPAARLVAALEQVHRGQVVVEYGSRRGFSPEVEGQTSLTPREAEIVTLITRGLDNLSIAREASLSINSVKSHIRSAYRKMGVSSRAQAVLWGVRNGYLEQTPAPTESPALTG